MWTCAHCILSRSQKSLKWAIFFTSYHQVFIHIDCPESPALSVCLYERCSNVTIAFRIFRGLRSPKENLNSKDWSEEVIDYLGLLYVTLLGFLCRPARTIFSLVSTLLPIFLSGRCMNKTSFALLKPKVVILYFALLPLLRILCSTISCSQGCPHLHMPALPFLQLSGPTEHLLPSAHWFLS